MSVKTAVKLLDDVFQKNNSSARGELMATLNQVAETYITYDLITSDFRPIIDKLYDIYENSTLTSNLEDEILFIEVLNVLGGCFIDYDSIQLFVKRYIKYSIDSAGYDLKLCSLSRSFILKLTLIGNLEGNKIGNSDDQYFKLKKFISDSVLNYLIEIYLNKIDIIDEKIDRSTQDYEERRRFLILNCKDLLVAHGIKETKNLLIKIDDHLVHKESRLRALKLLSSLVAAAPPDLYQILDTKMFDNLLNCLCYDNSSYSVSAANSILVMLLPHVCRGLNPYLMVLFVIYCRLLCWNLQVEAFEDENYDDTPQTEKLNPMDSQNYDNNEWEILEMEDDENTNTSIEVYNYKKLFTYLYGLYPMTFLNFIKNPLKFLELNTEKNNFTSQINSIISNEKFDEYEIRVISKELLKCYAIHENFFNYLTYEEELNDEQRWNRLGNFEDIAVACLSLDQYSFLKVPENNYGENEMNSNLTSSFIQTTPSTQQQQQQLSFNNKLSSSTSIASNPKALLDYQVAGDDINNLMESHRQLYSHGTAIRKMSSSSSSAISNSNSRKCSIISNNLDGEQNTSAINTSYQGTALDFYKRELLLMKNELEFTNYLKDLNKLKLKNLQEEVFKSSKDSVSLENSLMNLRLITNKNEKLLIDLNKLKDEFNKFKNDRLKYEELILNKNKGLKKSNEEFSAKIDDLIRENKSLNDHTDKFQKQLISKDDEIFKLQMTLKDTEEIFQNISGEKENNKNNSENVDKTAETHLGVDVVNDLKNENRNLILELDLKNSQIESLKNDYNNKINLLKFDNSSLSEKIKDLKADHSEYFQKIIKSYEFKIDELSRNLKLVQSSLYAKEKKLITLTTTQPIPINTNSNTSNNSRSDATSSISKNTSHVNSNSNNTSLLGYDRPVAVNSESFMGNFSSDHYGDIDNRIFESNPPKTSYLNAYGVKHNIDRNGVNNSNVGRSARHLNGLASNFSSSTNGGNGSSNTNSNVIKGRGGLQTKTSKKANWM
ncbi:hypothetical protein PACTADRAFT_50634 [Pachysolen tannophilus NRRL Y-2460]|uniref:Uncharacterized protein n=1 Tax=Pachysolen tannophilus NRRL Y-2460 TaxID=669874 RepID=A0A1E4TSM7_PACTA|nr:hypothetical protein PACTADRAFT_50634 [Pachysolen tannophilus NRRL Y-2460]